MSKPHLLVSAALLGLISVSLIQAQDKSARLTFDVVSIKPSAPGVVGGGIKPMPGGQEYVAQNLPVRAVMSVLYRVPQRQIVGGPDWLDTDRFEIDAKSEHSYNLEDLHTMFQNLLTDEFKLQFHKENREGAVYALVLDKSGPKMKVNESDQKFDIPITRGKDGIVVGTRVPIAYLCWWLGQNLQQDQRPIIDKTGLDKLYDFTLTFRPNFPPNFNPDNLPSDLPPGFLDRPTLFDALKEQLGLKLEPQKGPVEFFVIDHAEKPAGN
jgi:uncharacterized protein (TIGR03435 family)